MKTTAQNLEDNKVKLTVEVDESDFETALDQAFKRIAGQVKVPGFRPGKAPRKVLENYVNPEAAREEALRVALPNYYEKAVQEEGLDVIAQPQIEVTSGDDQGPVVFDAIVEVRPEVNIAGYKSLKITIPSPEATDEDVDKQMERLRNQFAELKTVERPAQDNDNVTIDISAKQGDEDVDALSTDDFLYEVGSARVAPELDDHLRGAKVGDILSFEAKAPALTGEETDEKVSFRVLVKEIKEKILPEVTDEWASEASEFETVDELKNDLATRIAEIKRTQARMAVRDEAVHALAELVSIELPESLIDADMRRQLQSIATRLEAQGANLMEYLQYTGQDEKQFTEQLRESAVATVKADLALRAVVAAENIQVTEDEITSEIEKVAQQVNQKPKEVRRQLERADQMPAVRSDLQKSKAVEWLVGAIEVVDEGGNKIDNSLLIAPTDGDE